MRRAKIYYDDLFAGILTETDEGEYIFQYDTEYLKNHPDKFPAFNLPVRAEKYISNRLFAFFDGLIPEGWLLDMVHTTWKIDSKDRMGLLLASCKNCIGAVSVHEISEEKNG
jgi:serine/threonine-protein kinase HipA